MSNSQRPEGEENPNEVTEEESKQGLIPARQEQTIPHELTLEGHSGHIVAPASLIAVGGPLAGRAFPLHALEHVIGRSRSEADIWIDDRSISSRHALIRRADSWHQVTDLGSTNGTVLNGRRLPANRPTDLHPGDTLQVAKTALVYLAEGATDTAELTQALAVAAPQYGGAPLNPDEVLLQILKMSVPVEERKATLDEQVDKVLAIVRKVRPYLPLVASMAALLALLGVATVIVSPPLAEASFTISLTPQAKENPVVEHNQQSNYFQFFVAAESNFVSSALIETTLKSIGISEPTEAQISAAEKQLSFTNLAPGSAIGGGGPATYRGVYMHRNSSEAVRFLKAHVENYLQTEITKTLKVVQRQVDFLVQQTKEKESELRETEAKLKAFRDKYLNMLPEYTEGHVTSLETLKQRQSDLKARVAATGAAVQAAKTELKMLSGIDESKVVVAQPFQQALADAKVRLAQARSSGLGESHPDVVRLREQVSSLEAERQKALAATPSSTEVRGNRAVSEIRRGLAQTEVDAQAASAELGQVTEQIVRLESIVRESPGVAEAYAELTRSYSVNTETNQRLLRELDEARVQLNAERASAEKRYEIVFPPRSKPIPIRRTLATRAAIGGGAGASLGIFVAAFLFVRRWFRERPQRMAKAALANAAALRSSATRVPSLRPGPSAKG
jgi:pSer/pThr/pTyr-binding forkhead associated (FHA) protein